MPHSDAHEPDTWFRDRPVLVTGGGGFIGAALTRRLLAVGADVHVVSRRPVHSRPSAGRIWNLDMGDTTGVHDVLAAAQPDIVFHLASRVTGSRGLDEVAPTLRDNLQSTVNILMAAAGSAVAPNVLITGSVEEPRPGEGGAAPSSPYGVSKWASTAYAQLFQDLWSVPVSVLRLAMVYGPAQPDRRKLLPYVMDTLFAGGRPQLTAGTRLIDWLYIDDAVDALLTAACCREALAGYRSPIDIGSGTGVSIRDTVEMVASIANRTGQIDFAALPHRPLEQARIADTRRAAELLGWRVATPLDVGLERTVKGHRSRVEA